MPYSDFTEAPAHQKTIYLSQNNYLNRSKDPVRCQGRDKDSNDMNAGLRLFISAAPLSTEDSEQLTHNQRM